jgi:short-subunit dehydrogenase
MGRPESHVPNVCSVAGLVAGPRSTAYHVSKFGLVGFTESLRAEYGRRGIGVTALCPGPVQTNLYKSGVSGSKRKPVPVPPAWLSATPARIADVAVRAIRKNRRLVLITPIAHLLFNAKRFAPWFLDWLNHFTLRKRRPAAGSTASTAHGLRPFVPIEAESEAEPAVRHAA